jgi:hypothetical protein
MSRDRQLKERPRNNFPSGLKHGGRGAGMRPLHRRFTDKSTTLLSLVE